MAWNVCQQFRLKYFKRFKQLVFQKYSQLPSCILGLGVGRQLQHGFTIPYHTIPYHTIQYHTIPGLGVGRQLQHGLVEHWVGVDVDVLRHRQLSRSADPSLETRRESEIPMGLWEIQLG